MAGITQGDCGYFVWGGKSPYFGHFLRCIGVAYSNNGAFGWFLHMIPRLLPTHFLVMPSLNEVQG
jgi:hypothetical protein